MSEATVFFADDESEELFACLRRSAEILNLNDFTKKEGADLLLYFRLEPEAWESYPERGKHGTVTGEIMARALFNPETGECSQVSRERPKVRGATVNAQSKLHRIDEVRRWVHSAMSEMKNKSGTEDDILREIRDGQRTVSVEEVREVLRRDTAAGRIEYEEGDE